MSADFLQFHIVIVVACRIFILMWAELLNDAVGDVLIIWCHHVVILLRIVEKIVDVHGISVWKLSHLMLQLLDKGDGRTNFPLLCVDDVAGPDFAMAEAVGDYGRQNILHPS